MAVQLPTAIATDGSSDVANTVSAGFKQKQIFELARESLDFLAGLALPIITEYTYPPVFISLWDLIRDKLRETRTFPKLAIGLPRGFGKTSFIKLVVLYAILYTDKQFPLIVGPTAGHAYNSLASIADMLDEPNIVATYGNWRAGLTIDRADVKQFIFRGRQIVIGALGQGGSIRGLNVKNMRPDLMLLDDIQSKEDAESQAVSLAIETWLYSTAMKSATHKGCLYLFVANMYPTPYSILKKLQVNPTWVKFIAGAILLRSDSAERGAGKERSDAAHDSVHSDDLLAMVDSNASDELIAVRYESLWEELKPLTQLLNEFRTNLAAGRPEIFYSEDLNDPDASVNTHIDVGAIPSYPWAEDEIGQGRFIVIDPSNDKENSDAVSIGAFDVIQGKPVSIEIEEGRFSPGKTVELALVMAVKLKCSLIVVEGNAYQASLCYWINKFVEEYQLFGITIVPIYSGIRSKNARILDMFKALMSGELYLHPRVRAKVCAQIIRFNPLKTKNVDGILDLLCYSTRVLIEFPHFIAINTTALGLANDTPMMGYEEDTNCF